MTHALAEAGSDSLSRWDALLRTWMSDPGGRLVLLICLFVLALICFLLIAIPLITRSIRLTFRRLAQGVEEIRRRGPAQDLPRDIDGEAAGLVASLNHLLGEFRGRLASLEGERNRIHAILNAPRDYGLIATDREGLILFLSNGARHLLGWSPDDLVGKSVEVLLREEDWNAVVPKLARRSLRETGLVQRVHLVRRDGTSFPATLSVSGMVQPDGTPEFVSVFRDLTEQAILERRLQESEDRHRGLAEAMTEGVVILQEDRITYANPAVGKILGRPPSEVAGHPFKEFIAAEDLLVVLDHLEKSAQGRGAVEFDVRLHRAGSSLPLEVRACFSRIRSGDSCTLLGTLRDETESRRSLRDLASSRTLLDATLDSTSDGILVVGLRAGERGPILVNRQMETLLGRRGEELLSWTEERLNQELARLGATPEDKTALETPVAPDVLRTALLTTAAPESRFLELCQGPVRSAQGAVTGRIVSLRDVTERRRAEIARREEHQALLAAQSDLQAAVAELQSARETLASRNEQLERLNRELRSLDEMKSSLLANLSHELQTPLVSIKGYTEMILKRKIGPITPEQEKGLTVALRNIDRLIEMIDNLLDFSRIERGETPLQLETFPLWQLIDETIDLLRAKIARKNVYVTTEYETEDLAIKADRAKISQVFINLLTNATKFNREGGRITIRVAKGSGGLLDVEVQDTGIGIPAEEQNRIFERFYQVHSAPHKAYEGTGIGLSIVKDILAMHGCSIRVESRLGEGTTFAFNLPLGRPSPDGSGGGAGEIRTTPRNNERTRL